MQYTINTNQSQDNLLSKLGINVQTILENKIEELVNKGQETLNKDIIDCCQKATPEQKTDLDNLLEQIRNSNI